MTLILSSCAGQPLAPPKVTTCVVDPEHDRMECFDPNYDNSLGPIYLNLPEDAKDFTCFPPESMRELMTWIRLRSHE